MGSLWKKIYLVFATDCERASRLLSDGLDRDLAFHERLAVRGHVLFCNSCMRFRSQLKFLHQSVKRAKNEELKALENGPKLSDEAKARIKKNLQA